MVRWPYSSNWRNRDRKKEGAAWCDFARSNTFGPFGIVNGPQIYDADIRNGK